jgi:hypothetical protein
MKENIKKDIIREYIVWHQITYDYFGTDDIQSPEYKKNRDIIFTIVKNTLWKHPLFLTLDVKRIVDDLKPL